MTLFSHIHTIIFHLTQRSLILTVTGARVCVCVRTCDRMVVDRRQTLGAVGCVCVCACAFVPPSCLDLGRKQAEGKKAQEKIRCCLVNYVIKMPHTHTLMCT